MAMLVATVLMGSGALPRVLPYFVPATTGLITPLWLLLYLAAGLGLMLGQGIGWATWMARYRILLVVLLFGTTASIAWSLVPYLSLERVVHLVGSSVLAIYIGFTVPLLSVLRTLGVVLGALLLASAAVAIGLPALGIEQYEGSQVWRGLFISKNALGFWSAVAVLLYITVGDSVRSFGTRMLCYLMAGVSLVTLVFSQSATSLVCLVIGGAAALFMFVAARFRLGFVRMGAVAIIIGGLAAFAVGNIDTAELVGRSGDLTGRGEVWRQTWNLVMQKPATGYGYGVLWFPAGGTDWIQESLMDFTWTVHHAHNGFLQVASEVGLPLAVIAVLWTVQQLIEILYCQYQRQQAGVLFVLGFTVAYLVSNYSEARFLVNRELYWILFIALPISMLRQINLVAAPAMPPRPDAFGGAPSVPGAPAHGGRPLRLPATVPGGAWAVGGAAAAGSGPMDGPFVHTTRTARRARSSGDTSELDFLDDDELDETVGTLGLTDADIDLGSLVDEPPARRDARAERAATAPEPYGPLDGLPDGPLKGPMHLRAARGSVDVAERDDAERALDARFTDSLDELFDDTVAPRRHVR